MYFEAKEPKINFALRGLNISICELYRSVYLRNWIVIESLKVKCCPDTFSSSHCSEKHFVLVCGCQFGQQELFSVSCWDRILAKVLCMQLSNPCGLWQVLHAFWRDIREIQSENGNYWNLLWVREKGLLEHESKFLSDSSQKSFGRKWEPTDFLSSDFFFSAH